MRGVAERKSVALRDVARAGVAAVFPGPPPKASRNFVPQGKEARRKVWAIKSVAVRSVAWFREFFRRGLVALSSLRSSRQSSSTISLQLAGSNTLKVSYDEHLNLIH